MILSDGKKVFNNVLFRNSDVRKVYRDRINRNAVAPRFRVMDARLLVNVFVKLHNKAVCFEQGKEDARLHIIVQLGVVPAHKRFTAVGAIARDVVLWLIEQLEVLVFQSAFHVQFNVFVLRFAFVEQFVVISEQSEIVREPVRVFRVDGKIDHLCHAVGDLAVELVNAACQLDGELTAELIAVSRGKRGNGADALCDGVDLAVVQQHHESVFAEITQCFVDSQHAGVDHFQIHQKLFYRFITQLLFKI